MNATISRFLALFLALSLSLPNSALALRVQNGGLEEKTPTVRAIENSLQGGLEETEQERTIKKVIQNLAHPEGIVRWAAQGTLSDFARAGIAAEPLAGAVPQTVQNLARPEDWVVFAAQETLAAFAQNGIATDALSAAVPQTVQNLAHPEGYVRSAAQETLSAFAQAGIAAEPLAGAVPQTVQNLAHPEGYVRQAAQRTLSDFAQYPRIQQALKTAGLTPHQLGFPQGTNWNAVARLEQTTAKWSSLPDKPELSLGGRAFLRRKRLKAAAGELDERWHAHAVRLEKLDRLAGLASAGAEIHLPVKTASESRPLEWLAVQMASGVGPHAMVPWILEGDGRQIDIRLLPAYPAVFRRLLAEMLSDAAMAKHPVVGAHYSVGLDLKTELVPVALALYYGDENYLESPQPGSAEGGVGFPGVWTYRGQSLDLETGRVTNVKQSNLHLRPLRTFVGEIPLDLFQHDVDRIGWLAAAAAAPAGNPRQTLYQEFKSKWEQWVRKQGGESLWKTVRAAEQGVAGKTGAGVSPELDKASADLLAAMYKTPEQGIAARKELAGILDRTLEQLEQAAWGSAAAAKAIRAYRESDGLADLDQTLDTAIQMVKNEIFSTDTGRGSSRETQLLNALDLVRNCSDFLLIYPRLPANPRRGACCGLPSWPIGPGRCTG